MKTRDKDFLVGFAGALDPTGKLVQRHLGSMPEADYWKILEEVLGVNRAQDFLQTPKPQTRPRLDVTEYGNDRGGEEEEEEELVGAAFGCDGLSGHLTEEDLRETRNARWLSVTLSLAGAIAFALVLILGINPGLGGLSPTLAILVAVVAAIAGLRRLYRNRLAALWIDAELIADSLIASAFFGASAYIVWVLIG